MKTKKTNEKNMVTSWMLLGIALFLAVALAGCESDCDPVTPEPIPGKFKVPLRDIDISYHTDSSFFLVMNSGGSSLDWTAVCLADFIDLENEAGDLYGGESNVVEIAINRTGLPNGISTATILVSSDTSIRVEIKVTVEVGEQ